MNTSTPVPPSAWATVLGLRPTLDEDEALLAPGELRRSRSAASPMSLTEVDAEVPPGLGPRRVDQPERPLARPLQPFADHLRIADGRREADALNVAPADA